MLFYLATPYSHPYAYVRELRFKAAAILTAKLIESGVQVFCPISHSHPIETYGFNGRVMPTDFWLQIDKPLMERCDALMIGCLPGWDRSTGVTAERQWFAEQGRPSLKLDEAMLMLPYALRRQLEDQEKLDQRYLQAEAQEAAE